MKQLHPFKPGDTVKRVANTSGVATVSLEVAMGGTTTVRECPDRSDLIQVYTTRYGSRRAVLIPAADFELVEPEKSPLELATAELVESRKSLNRILAEISQNNAAIKAANSKQADLRCAQVQAQHEFELALSNFDKLTLSSEAYSNASKGS